MENQVNEQCRELLALYDGPEDFTITDLVENAETIADAEISSAATEYVDAYCEVISSGARINLSAIEARLVELMRKRAESYIG